MSKSKTIKAKWAAKLLRAKYFVLLTDKDSVICFKGADPASFTDQVMLTSQATELRHFSEKLKSLVKEHDKALELLTKSAKTRKI